MPTGQTRGEPVVEVALDKATRLAKVTITNLIPKHAKPVAQVHHAKDGSPPRVEVLNVHEGSQPEANWEIGPAGTGDTVTITGICLNRCTDEPGRMKDDEILDHVLLMALTALQDKRETLQKPRQVPAPTNVV